MGNPAQAKVTPRSCFNEDAEESWRTVGPPDCVLEYDADLLILFLIPRDLIKKLLVVDRTKRLGNMKVSVSLIIWHQP